MIAPPPRSSNRCRRYPSVIDSKQTRRVIRVIRLIIIIVTITLIIIKMTLTMGLVPAASRLRLWVASTQ